MSSPAIFIREAAVGQYLRESDRINAGNPVSRTPTFMYLPGARPPSQPPGIVARYFLRRRALVHRKYSGNETSAQHNRAVMETILIFVGLPTIALGSFLGNVALRWAPSPIVSALESAPYIFACTLVVLSFVIGYLSLGKKLRIYRGDCTAYLQFDSDKDREIIFWQKVTATVICFIVIPFIAIYVAFGDQGLINAFVN